MTPPKPKSRADDVSLFHYLRLFRRDILSAQPERLYRAKMAEFRTAFFRSYFINQPDLIHQVLNDRPMDFPKSDRIGAGLRPLLGNSVFLSNGALWQRQRRIINPAFEGGRLRDTFAPMLAAGQALVGRMVASHQPVEIEEVMSFGAADVIFRTLFSVPIDSDIAAEVFAEFQRYQLGQPILNLAAFIPVPRWFPRFHRRSTRESARKIRALITGMTRERLQEIQNGSAPDDLATKIMTQTDPETGQRFDVDEMVDQVAIFFLAGHETSAAALGWALYLLALNPDIQDRATQEVSTLPANPQLKDIAGLKFTRDAFREALRLYPPVPMLVRENRCPENFRKRHIRKHSQIVISPWHLHRNGDIWENPDEFDPDRFSRDGASECLRDGFIPFSSGERICPGAGFAMVEGVLFLALLLGKFRFETVPGKMPQPQAHLTVRSKNGIWLAVHRR